jgi:hypothetical protein
LIARGTSTDTILFTSDQLLPTGQQGWSGLEIQNPNANDVFTFEYCRFENAYNAAIRTSNSMVVTNCIFKNNIQSIRGWNKTLYVSDCLFFNNQDGVSCDSHVPTLVEKCGFVNTAYPARGGRVNFRNNNVFNCVNGINGCDSVTDNLFEYSSNYAIFKFRYLANNKIWHSNTAVYYNGGTAEYNTIKYCNTGFLLYDAIADSSVRHNCITYCKIFSVDSKHSGDDSKIVDNYWGVTDSVKIDSLVYDYYDDFKFSTGIVNFMPFLNSPHTKCVDTFSRPPYYNTSINTVRNNINVQVYPNPVNDNLTIESGIKITSVAIHDITGKIITQQNINNNKATISTESYARGVYLYKILLQNGSVQTGKIFKE